MMKKSSSISTLTRLDLYRQHIQDQVVSSVRSLAEGAIQGVARFQQKVDPYEEPDGRVNQQFIRLRAKVAIATALMTAGVLGAATCDESTKSPDIGNNVVNVQGSQK